MKFLLILSLLASPTVSFAKDAKAKDESKTVALGFFLLFCPMCIPAVVEELEKDKIQKDTPKPIPVRSLASDQNKTKKTSQTKN